MRAPTHPRQAERLNALKSLDILDTPREERFDRIVELAAEICEAPIAVINLIDEKRQWFKAEVGLGVRETPLETSICSHVILQQGLTVIPDTLADPRMCDNPLCLSTPNLRFYAGALLHSPDGLPVGTLCVLDYKPRDLTPLQRKTLAVLADQVTAQMLLSRELRRLEELRVEVDHRVKNSLGLVQSVLGLQARQASTGELRDALDRARGRVAAIASIHQELHEIESHDVVEFGQLLKRLTRELEAHMHAGVALVVETPPFLIGARAATNAVILVNELVTNAVRHGFPDEGTGNISIRGTPVGGTMRLTIADDGGGLPDGFDPNACKGLGMRLAMSIARQLGNGLTWSRLSPGTAFTFDIPGALPTATALKAALP